MDLFYLILLFSSPILFLIGLSLLIGMGWALIIFDLIFHQVNGPYHTIQESAKSLKGIKYKMLGIILITLSIILFFYAIGK